MELGMCVKTPNPPLTRLDLSTYNSIHTYTHID